MSNQTYSLYRQVWGILDFLFPPICGGCEKRGKVWCDDCQQTLKLLRTSLCDICGSENVIRSAGCPFCGSITPLFRSARSYAYYEDRLRHAIHQIKYHRDLSLGIAFSELLLSIQCDLNWPFELVVPVPLSKSRFKQRGYNQTALIAYPFALGSGKAYSSKALRRTRDTPSQVNYSHAERVANVIDAFVAERQIVENKTVLVVDDVYTTGATLNACADALFTAGAREVFCLTVARSKYMF